MVHQQMKVGRFGPFVVQFRLSDAFRSGVVGRDFFQGLQTDVFVDAFLPFDVVYFVLFSKIFVGLCKDGGVVVGFGGFGGFGGSGVVVVVVVMVVGRHGFWFCWAIKRLELFL